jgi:hypothetical protein
MYLWKFHCYHVPDLQRGCKTKSEKETNVFLQNLMYTRQAITYKVTFRRVRVTIVVVEKQ